MANQITIRLDDALDETARAAATDAGVTLTSWVRAAIARQAALATALRARAQEDARAPLYTEEQEDALVAARQQRAIAAFEQ